MERFEKQRTALLLMDFQNYGLHPEGYWARQGIADYPARTYPAVEAAARVLASARAAGLLIVHVRAAWRKGSPEMNLSIPVFARGTDRSLEGTWGSDFYDPVKPAEGEFVVTKRSVSALAGTELHRLFRVRDVNTLVLAGIVTNFVVEGTAREAVDHGYRVIVLEDCCASITDEMHRFSIDVILRELCQITSSEEFMAALGS